MISDEATDRLLQTRETPKAPPQFTSRTMGKVRHDRRQREQVIDIGFNLVIGAISVSIVMAFWLLLSWSGVWQASGQVFELVRDETLEIARQAAPSVPLYVGATAVVGTALGVWWWAERDPRIG